MKQSPLTFAWLIVLFVTTRRQRLVASPFAPDRDGQPYPAAFTPVPQASA
jgi:hypothetical protein